MRYKVTYLRQFLLYGKKYLFENEIFFAISSFAVIEKNHFLLFGSLVKLWQYSQHSFCSIHVAEWTKRQFLSHVRDGRWFEPGYCQNLFFIIIQRILTKVRSRYPVSITSNPADQKKNIRRKNNNKIAGKWDCWVCQILQFRLKKGRIIWF